MTMNYRHSPITTNLIAALVLLAPSAHAQGEAPRPQTLAQALALAAAPKSELYIAVDAEKVTLPKDAAPAEAGATVARVATVFGRRVGGFGNVDAIAPATITVVDVPPDKINPYDGMEPKKLIKQLTKGFSNDQWKAFLSTDGVGYSDLKTDEQRAIFQALFPDGHMALEQMTEVNHSSREIGGDALKTARLRVAYRTSIALSVPGKPGTHTFANGYLPPGHVAPYAMANAASGNVDKEYGATVRETVPNTAKPNDLPADDAALRAGVAAANCATVDDAVRAIAAATGREIYADPRYAKKTLTVVGPGQSVRALDLLRALALCVGGTYRKVGTAYVLTDDLAGLGAKHQLWKEFEDKAKSMLPGGDSPFPVEAPDSIPYTVQDIPWTGDDYPMSESQQSMFWKEWRKTGMQGDSATMEITIPFAQLTPQQQEAARAIQAQNAKDHISSTLDGDVMLQGEAMVEVTLPSLDAPVVLFQSYDRLLPYPKLTQDEQTAAMKRMEGAFGAALRQKPDAPLEPMAKSLAPFSRRAVRVAAHSKDDLTKDIAAMKALDLNELWLSITPGATEDDDAASIDLLREAVKEAKGVHIAVYPAVSLLVWSEAAPDTLLDRTVTGRTTTQQNALSQMPRSDIQDTVTPFDPEVGRRLAALIGKAASVRGVAGVIWDNSIAAGYERITKGQPEMGIDILPLGYTVAGRLAYLRKEHADPIDLHDNSYGDKRAHVGVPGFDDDFDLERTLYQNWRKMRSECAQGMTQWLAAALPHAYAPDQNRLPVLLTPANSTYSRLYGSWDDFRQPPPTVEYIPQREADGKPMMGAILGERMASQLEYHSVITYLPTNAKDDAVARAVSSSLRDMAQRGERAVVFDAIRRPALLTQLRDAEAARAKADAKRPQDQK